METYSWSKSISIYELSRSFHLKDFVQGILNVVILPATNKIYIHWVTETSDQWDTAPMGCNSHMQMISVACRTKERYLWVLHPSEVYWIFFTFDVLFINIYLSVLIYLCTYSFIQVWFSFCSVYWAYVRMMRDGEWRKREQGEYTCLMRVSDGGDVWSYCRLQRARLEFGGHGWSPYTHCQR